MPKHPLFPLLRAGLLLGLGVSLMCKPRRQHDAPAAATLGGYLVDVGPEMPPAPPGGRVVPPEPFPGQVTPDARGRCTDPDDVVLNGGCWAKMAKQPHPATGCGERYFRRGDACYAPVMKAPRLPSSIGE